MAKDYFDEKAVKYTDYNVQVDERARDEMIEKTGQMGVPVIIVSGDGAEDIIVGFDKSRLASVLGFNS